MAKGFKTDFFLHKFAHPRLRGADGGEKGEPRRGERQSKKEEKKRRKKDSTRLRGERVTVSTSTDELRGTSMRERF